MKGRVRVEFSFEFGANQLLNAQLLLQRLVFVISRNLGAKPRDKQCLRPFRFRDDGKGKRAANTDMGLSARYNNNNNKNNTNSNNNNNVHVILFLYGRCVCRSLVQGSRLAESTKNSLLLM
jgi:hypothetical protein